MFFLNSDNEKCCGNVVVSVYEDTRTGFHFFKVNADNEDVLPVSYVIEDTLKLF